MSILSKSFRSVAVTLFLLSLLLVSAGRLDYWQAWVYAAISLSMSLATQFVLRDQEDLSKERSKPGKGMQKWDRAILGVGFLLTLATLVIAGLDTGRFFWSPQIPWEWSFFGVALNVAGMSIFLRAMTENKFFSSVVRIQDDRKHLVCSSGPYKIVRHPGYLGMIIGTMGFPFLFLSFWSIVPTLLSVANLLVRTVMEDRFLAKELGGYRAYQNTTRFLLIPGVF